MTKRIIRFSEVRNFQDCKRSWMNGYQLGLMKPEFDGDTKPSKANIGTYCHKDLEQFYNGATSRPGEFHATVAVPESAEYQKEWDAAYRMASVMLEGYDEWLDEEGQDAGETTIATELELEVPFGTHQGDEVVLQVHIDRVLTDSFDRLIIEDTKTVDTLAKDSTFQIESQLLTYALAWNTLHPDQPVAECRHNMLRRVLRTARATPPFYGRVPMTPSATQLENHKVHLWSLLCDVVRSYQALENGSDHHAIAPPHPTKDCSWKCAFLPICGSYDDGSDLDGMRQALYIKREKEA